MNPPDDVLSAKANGDARADVETDERERRLNGAIRELIKARESGVEPDRQAWLARYPEFHQELTAYLETDDQVHWLVHTLVPAEPASGVRFGPYRIVRMIGKGGMGVVYEVEESGTSRRLALKVLPTCGLPDSENRARFRREAESLTQLDHPNIVPILALHEIGGIPAIVMPLIEGMDLRTIRRQLERARNGAASSDREARADEPESHVVANPDKPEDQARLDGTSPPWRAIAVIGLQAARALAHAHERGILHRDVKPSNLVLDNRGTVLLTDFGLADPVGPGQAEITATGDVVGTLRYLAPERLHGWRDPRSDIYSLGLTLYELLVARPAFGLVDRGRLLRAIELESPPQPRKSRRDIPKDLETIVLKAIQKEPKDRYPSAHALADDLKRFLEGKPIVARLPGAGDRLARWAGRNVRAVAAAAVVLSLVIVSLSLSLVSVAKARKQALAAAQLASQEKQKALAAAQLASQEKQKALASAHDSQYESLAQRLVRILWTNQARGWSDEAIRAIDAMAEIRKDDRLQGLALAALQGLDVRPAGSIPRGGQTLAFDRTGGRLVVSGYVMDGFAGEPKGTTVWNLNTGTSQTPLLPAQRFAAPKSLNARDVAAGDVAEAQWTSTIRDSGPVAFRPDGTPIQLTADGTQALRLWDVSQDRVIATFPMPIVGAVGPKQQAGHPTRTLYDFTLTPDGRLVAASVREPDDRRWVFVWEAASGRRLLQLPGRAQSLAFAPDGSLLAGGSDAAKIHVWSMPDGSEINTPSVGETTVNCLAFGPRRGRDFRAIDTPVRPGRGWWLAAGDQGGKVTVWDAETGALQFKATGDSDRVFSLAFSTDGTLLASGGHFDAKLWDVNHGRELLDVGLSGSCLGLAFTPDGRRLAANVFAPRGSAGEKDSSRVEFSAIEGGRGIESFRGLAAPAAQLVFAPDGRYLAAMAHDWRVAIWDRKTGMLRLVLEPPEGSVSSSAALAFSRDGRRIAFASGQDATLWDVETGRRLGAWPLPRGLIDILGYQPSGKLVLFRVETKPETGGPFRGVPFEQFPRVGRIRELLESGRTRTIAEIDRFNRHVFDAVAPDDLSYVVIDGVTIDATGEHRSIACFDGSTGRSLWSIPQPNPPMTGSLNHDPSRRLLAVQFGDKAPAAIYRMPDGTPLGTANGWRGSAPGRHFAVMTRGLSDSGRGVLDVLDAGDGRRLLTLGAETLSKAGHAFQLSPDGQTLAWSLEDGTVALADLPELNARLTPLGLGWKEENGSKK
ncbi:MAG: WD40 repeat domain-containing serine/threonine-protein kinase [Isosphaerales bacterium]